MDSSRNLQNGESSLKSPDNENAFICLNPSGIRLSNQGLTILLKAVLEKGKRFRFCASGQSMFPLIMDGDVLTISVLRDRNAKIGEVVAYIHPVTDRLLVHRVIRANGRFFSIKADSVKTAIDNVSADQVLGVTTKVERNGKSIRFGLGFERVLISFLTRHNLFVPLVKPISKFGALKKDINFSHGQTRTIRR